MRLEAQVVARTSPRNRCAPLSPPAPCQTPWVHRAGQICTPALRYPRRRSLMSDGLGAGPARHWGRSGAEDGAAVAGLDRPSRTPPPAGEGTSREGFLNATEWRCTVPITL